MGLQLALQIKLIIIELMEKGFEKFTDFFLIKQGEWDLQQVFPKKTSNVINLFLNVFLALLTVKHAMENAEYWLFCICFYLT